MITLRAAIHDEHVSDVTPLAAMTSLKRLNLAVTLVKGVTPLAGLTSLEELDLSGTLVTDVTPLAGLTSLKVLGLKNTPVSRNDYETLRKALPNCEISWSPANP